MLEKLRLNRSSLTAALVLCAVLHINFADGAGLVAGQVEFVEGNVRIVNAAGQSRLPSVGETLYEADTINTGNDGELHAHMADEGYIAVRPNTTLKIDTYISKATDGDSVVISLIKGTFRSITGWIGRNNPRNYRINAGPVATIGVRGTDHEPAFIPDPAPGETPVDTPGAYDKVNSGKTFIQHPGGIIELGPHQSGFAPRDPRIAPYLLKNPPRFYRPTKNEFRIDRRVRELSTQIGKKHNERLRQTRRAERGVTKKERSAPLRRDIHHKKRLEQ